MNNLENGSLSCIGWTKESPPFYSICIMQGSDGSGNLNFSIAFE